MTPLSTLEGIAREFEKFRRRVYIILIAGFLLIGAGTFVIVIGYLSSQQDFHRGSCTSRLVLRQLLQRAEAATEKTPTSAQFTPAQKQQALDFYRDGIGQIMVDDCGDIHLPPLPVR